MSETMDTELILKHALELERDYDWIGAVDFYEKALGLVPVTDFLKLGEVQERMGYGLFRAACQADSVDEFKNRMRRSVESYEKAAELFEKVDAARGLYCRAMARYSEFWFAEEPSRRKELSEHCWELMKESFERFDAAGDQLGFGKVISNLSFYFFDRFTFAEDWREKKRFAEEALRYGQDTIAKLSKLGNLNELANAYTMTSLMMIELFDWFEERKEEFVSTISNYTEKALALSEKIDDAYFHAFLNFVLGEFSWSVKGDLRAASLYDEKLLQQAQKLNDHALLGYFAYPQSSFVAYYGGFAEEDPDKSKEEYNLAIQFAEKAIQHSLLVCRYGWITTAYVYLLVGSYQKLAELETSNEGKSALLKRAVEAGRKGAEYAELDGSPAAMYFTFHGLSRATHSLSEIETSNVEKRKLLEEALELRENHIRNAVQLSPPDGYLYGMAQNLLALIKADLAKMEENVNEKRRLLEEAVSSMEKSIEIHTRFVKKVWANPLPSDYAVLGRVHDRFAEILEQLYSLTRDDKVVVRAIELYQGTAQVYQKAEMPSRVAEAHWKSARLYDQRHEYAKAAENFEQASKNYQLVAEEIPQFESFYEDQKSYMQAWSEFEKAKLAHGKEEYEQSKTHYENAANLLTSTKRWNYLAPNFAAWATLEQAEDLTKTDKNDESRQAFQLAAHQFGEAKASLEEGAKKIENPDEKAKTLELSNTIENRKEYCLIRAELEEARIYDKNENHSSSAKKYGSVAESFEKIAERHEDESDRKELLFQAHLCWALERMELAEEKADPDLYAEASELFTKTQKITANKRNALLAMGNACFCKALESGTKFKLTPNVDLYTTAKQYMERAAHYYTEAGVESAAKWMQATQRFFDAYFYMCNAESEVDPEKKAKNYQLAEKHLDLAAHLYETAGYTTKRDETLRHLERVREEKELLISPAEILKARTIVSATHTVSALTPTKEEAVGLEELEHANIQANLITRLKEIKVGEDLNLEIELVNAGKRPALLIKTEHIIPEGFEIKEKPEIYRVEDSYLNMKGKRLDPLKTEEVKLVLTAHNKGTFTIKPRVLYLDETGKYKSHEPEPTTIKVKELGISGWIKGA